MEKLNAATQPSIEREETRSGEQRRGDANLGRTRPHLHTARMMVALAKTRKVDSRVKLAGLVDDLDFVDILLALLASFFRTA